jgi:hypothetical protein
MRHNTQALWYVVSQMAAKGMAAIAQLYAIYVFTRIHAPNDAALIFLLLGYGIWIQIFEFGVSQVIQNGLNSKALSVAGTCQIIILHYGLMIIFAALVMIFPEVLDSFKGERRVYEATADALAFSVGVALMLVATNNILVQRMLLVINRGMVASQLILFQAMLSIAVLMIFQWRGASLIWSVAIFLIIPIMTYAPLVFRFTKKVWINRNKLYPNWPWIFKNALGFWGLTALSSVYLGADYFYAAIYLTNEEMIAFHFTSRLFFISYIAYFSYVQYRAIGITAVMHDSRLPYIWIVVKWAIFTGILAVVLVLLATILLKWSGAFDVIGASELVVMPLILSAALYYFVRIFRDVGLVIIWNSGLQRFLYTIHLLEVVLCLLLLELLASELRAKGIFFAMALVAALSTVFIYILLRRMLPDSLKQTIKFIKS